jgi:GT2 family glycosyltransferase
MSKTQVDVIIVNWNSGIYLSNALQSINKSNISVINQVIVVDNNSSDNSFTRVAESKWLFKTVYIRNEENIGFGRACNKASQLCSQKYILFLNPDTAVNYDSISSCLEFMEKDVAEKYAVCGVQLIDSIGRVSRSCARIPSFTNMINASIGLDLVAPRIFPGIIMKEWDHMQSRDVGHVIGAFYFIRTYIFKDMGGFNENYFLYYEDLDLSSRLKSGNFLIRYIVHAGAIHIGGGCSAKILIERRYLSNKSKIEYVRNFFHGYKKLFLEFIIGKIEIFLIKIVTISEQIVKKL